ncbi:MAG: transglycosylase domain-containing protein [Acidimicrobiales bacterium]
MRVLLRFLVCVALAGLGVAAGTVLMVKQAGRVFGASVSGTGGDPLSLEPLAARSVVYARDGSVLTTLHEEENRVPVPLAKVPPQVVRAVLDAEDDRFYEHGAIDLRGLTRAMVVNIQSGGVTEGGSTITQQLIKISLLNSQQKAGRKIKEAVLAIRLESTMTKDQILERYVNAIYLGNHAYGLEAAAETYFQKSVDQLDMGQGILLASLIRDPVGGDPWTAPKAARARRDIIVDRMRDLGHLSSAEADAIKGQPMPTPPPAEPAKGTDYFAEEVKQLLLADPRLGATPAERYASVFKGGLTIRTTLDPGFQAQAEQSVADVLPDSGGQFHAAVVSVDPTSGAVRALVGGSDFSSAKFDLAVQGARFAGSAFKPFTLMAALESGFSPDDTINGAAPCPIPNPGAVDPVWTPGNVEGEAPGVLSITDATVNSVNCAYARLVKLVGPQNVVDVAKRMGITSHLDPFLSITLGTSGVSPLEMADAYATLAADGEHHAPYFIDSVVDSRGKVIFKTTPKGDRVVTTQNARTETKVLTQVVQRGTGTAAAVSDWTVAGKTGTTDNYTNAWFVGYTPTLATAVWMGSPQADVPMRSVGGITVYGGTYPARIWHEYMTAALSTMTPVDFPAPDPTPYSSQYRSIDDGGFAPQVQSRRVAPTPAKTPAAVPAPKATTPATRPATTPVVTVPDVTVPNLPDITVPTSRRRPRLRDTVPTG